MIKLEVKNLKIVKQLERNLKDLKTKEVAIGVLEGVGNYENGKSVAEVGTTHEYGSITKKIPQRSFLRTPFYQQQSRVDKVVNLSYKALTNGNVSVVQALSVVGTEAVNISKGSFSDSARGEWKANSPMTVKMKGSSKPLIDTGRLRQSINYVVRNKTQG